MCPITAVLSSGVLELFSECGAADEAAANPTFGDDQSLRESGEGSHKGSSGGAQIGDLETVPIS